MTAGVYAMRAALKTVLIEWAIFGGQVDITKEVENDSGLIERKEEYEKMKKIWHDNLIFVRLSHETFQ